MEKIISRAIRPLLFRTVSLISDGHRALQWVDFYQQQNHTRRFLPWREHLRPYQRIDCLPVDENCRTKNCRASSTASHRVQPLRKYSLGWDETFFQAQQRFRRIERFNVRPLGERYFSGMNFSMRIVDYAKLVIPRELSIPAATKASTFPRETTYFSDRRYYHLISILVEK